MKRFRYLTAWFLVRPYRWFFSMCIIRGSFGIQWLPERQDSWEWCDDVKDGLALRYVRWPNLHWVLLYHTVFEFFGWLEHEAWRPLCRWENGRRASMPWYARVIRRIGKTTHGGAVSCFECYHCAAEEGCQVELSGSDDPGCFELEKQWTVGTEDGTDYRFRGTTICPKCGYRDEFEDGSL